MTIRVDSHYLIGEKHLINQDYALAEPFTAPFVVVADGCSSSADTDVGARLIALAARKYLHDTLGADARPHPAEMTRYVALKAQTGLSLLGLAQRSLDATLITAYVVGGEVEVILAGDGAVLSKSRSGEVEVVTVEYSNNAPCYPSYQLSAHDNALYQQLSAERQATKTIRRSRNGVEVSCIEEPLISPTVVRMPLAELAMLAICSDGIESFRCSSTLEEIPAAMIAAELLSLRSTEGEFMKRRLKRATQTLAGRGITHSDDLAVAAMVFD